MPRIVRIVALLVAVVALGSACSGSGIGASASPSASTVSPTAATGSTGTTINASGPPPTTSPGITGSVNHGDATLSVSGDVTSSLRFASLGAPALWSPPPGEMVLSFTGAPGAQDLVLGGPSFTGAHSTSDGVQLSFDLNTESGSRVRFVSSAGECSISVDVATAQQVRGSFTCGQLASTQGSLTVSAQGTFFAAG